MSLNTSRLLVAAKKGDEGRVKQYIKAGDDINAVNERGFTPLMVSVGEDCLKIVQLLLEAGADTSHQSISGGNALAGASLGGNVAIVRALLRAGADINVGLGTEEGTPLMIAATAGNVGVVRLLIEEGCDVRKRGVSGATALYTAVREGHTDIAEILLKSGVDVDETSEKGNTVLAWAAYNGDYATATKLLERGADVSLANAKGYTPLHFSAFRGSVEVTKVLLRAGADPHKQIFDNRHTPLHLACMERHIECVRLLLCAGANVSAVDSDGATPLHYAVMKPGPDGVSIEIIELLLSAGAEFRIVDNDGNLPLLYAVERGDAKSVSLLLEAGSDINRLNKLGRNILFESVDLDVVKLLLSKGADATVVDIFGYTVLHVAVGKKAGGGVICALCKAGADPTARNADGNTAADAARSRGNTETAKLLDLLADKYRATRGNTSESVDSDDAKQAKMSAAAAMLNEVRKLKDERKVDSNEVFTLGDIVSLVESFNIDLDACEEVKESVEECKDDQQSSSALPCLNCEAMTSRRCSGCGISYFCSKKCEAAARHLCCG